MLILPIAPPEFPIHPPHNTVTRTPIILQMENWSLLYLGLVQGHKAERMRSPVTPGLPTCSLIIPTVSLKKCLWMIAWSWGSHLGFRVYFHRGTWSYCVERRIHGLWNAGKKWIPGLGNFCWNHLQVTHKNFPLVSLPQAESYTRMTYMESWRWHFSCVNFPNQLTSLNLPLFIYRLLTTVILYFGLILNILWG